LALACFTSLECTADDVETLKVFAEHLDIQFEPSEEGKNETYSRGRDGTSGYSTEDVGKLARLNCGLIPEVREGLLLPFSELFHRPPGLVAETGERYWGRWFFLLLK